jgi:hypothetical protein
MTTQSSPSEPTERSEIKSLPQAQEYAQALSQWAKERWGVEYERKYVCPVDEYHNDYEGYCPNDGRKLKETELECQAQTWRHNLEDFMYMPEYPADATNEETTFSITEKGEEVVRNRLKAAEYSYCDYYKRSATVKNGLCSECGERLTEGSDLVKPGLGGNTDVSNPPQSKPVKESI